MSWVPPKRNQSNLRRKCTATARAQSTAVVSWTLATSYENQSCDGSQYCRGRLSSRCTLCASRFATVSGRASVESAVTCVHRTAFQLRVCCSLLRQLDGAYAHVSLLWMPLGLACSMYQDGDVHEVRCAVWVGNSRATLVRWGSRCSCD